MTIVTFIECNIFINNICFSILKQRGISSAYEFEATLNHFITWWFNDVNILIKLSDTDLSRRSLDKEWGLIWGYEDNGGQPQILRGL